LTVVGQDMKWLVCRSGNGICATSMKLSYIESSYYWDWGWPWAGLSYQYLSRPLSLAIPLWIGAMSTGDSFGCLWKKQRLW